MILDHGYLKLVESWGSDEAIIEAARMSTQKGFLGWGPKKCDCRHALTFDEPIPDCARCKGCGTVPGDEGLLAYLRKNHHDTPFEFAGMVVEVQAPIMVFREWHRHRTQSYNEMSARYTPLPAVDYLATVDRMMLGGGQLTRQAGSVDGAERLTPEVAAQIREEEQHFQAAAEKFYQRKLRAGVPKELARTHLGVARYSRMRASANLRNWLGFMTLRSTACNPHAQWEIRQYADAIGGLLAERFPRTWALFSDGPA